MRPIDYPSSKTRKSDLRLALGSIAFVGLGILAVRYFELLAEFVDSATQFEIVGRLGGLAVVALAALARLARHSQHAAMDLPGAAGR